MADDQFDACECLCSHELAARRLLSMLRQGQAYCTDTECLDLTRLPGQTESNEGSSFMLLTMLIILALTLYAFRPMRRRRQLTNNGKPKSSSEDSNDGAGPPPPAIH